MPPGLWPANRSSTGAPFREMHVKDLLVQRDLAHVALHLGEITAAHNQIETALAGFRNRIGAPWTDLDHDAIGDVVHPDMIACYRIRAAIALAGARAQASADRDMAVRIARVCLRPDHPTLAALIAEQPPTPAPNAGTAGATTTHLR